MIAEKPKTGAVRGAARTVPVAGKPRNGLMSASIVRQETVKSVPARTGVFEAMLGLAMTCIAIGSAGAAQIETDRSSRTDGVEIQVGSGSVERFLFASRAVGERYRIQVRLPMTYTIAPDTRFPVVYITDADASFGTASEIAFLAETDFLDRSTAPAILVGIGYEDPASWPYKRTRDLSPENSIDRLFLDFTEKVLDRPAETGGAAAFLAFLEEELHPEIVRRYRVAGDTAGLMTNSQGGVFGFFAFLQNSRLFDRYWIGSPAIFGRGTYLVGALAQRIEAGFDRPTRIYMSLGALERTLSLNGAMPMEMHQLSARSFSAIDAQLAAVDDPNLTYKAEEFAGETHNSVVIPAMSRAYRFLQQGGQGDE